jgi:hypothetical protein
MFLFILCSQVQLLPTDRPKGAIARNDFVAAGSVRSPLAMLNPGHILKLVQSCRRLTTFTIALSMAIALPIKPSLADESNLPRSYIGSSELLTNPNSPLAIGDTFQSWQNSASNDTRVMPNLSSRLQLGRFSLRTALLVDQTTTSFVPALSFDLPMGKFTNIYLGAGGLLSKEETSSGDRHTSSWALQPGAEVSLNQNLLLYGNLVIPLDRQWQLDQTRTSIQGGIGFQF